MGDDDDSFDDLRDDLYDEAVRIVIETNQASIAIQRRLRIGYSRAARMVERMERQGLVEPRMEQNGASAARGECLSRFCYCTAGSAASVAPVRLSINSKVAMISRESHESVFARNAPP